MSTSASRSKLVLAASIAGALLSGATAAGASASTLYVSGTAPIAAKGRSCAQPNANKVQEAITAGGSGARIEICPGTYTEQLRITQPVTLAAINGAGTVTLALPAAASASATACDASGQIDEIAICNTGGTVALVNLEIEALAPIETCAGKLDGVFVAGEGTLKETGGAIDGASTTLNAFKGCQHGVALYVGGAQPGHASINNVTVSGYEKNGPTVVGTGSTLAVSASRVTGEGPSPYTAQNGIEVAFGGKGTIKTTSVAGNECNVGSCGATGEQASGVLFYQAAHGSTLTSSLVKESDDGVYFASGSASESSTPEVTVSGDTLTDNRYEGIDLEEGKAALKSDVINGAGRVGIDLNQSAAQESSSRSSATSTTIEGQSEAAIKVESDKSPSDKPGKFTFANGSASGNGAVLINESSNFTVLF